MTKGKQGKNNYDAAEYNAVQRECRGKCGRKTDPATLVGNPFQLHNKQHQTITEIAKNNKKQQPKSTSNCKKNNNMRANKETDSDSCN